MHTSQSRDLLVPTYACIFVENNWRSRHGRRKGGTPSFDCRSPSTPARHPTSRTAGMRFLAILIQGSSGRGPEGHQQQNFSWPCSSTIAVYADAMRV